MALERVPLGGRVMFKVQLLDNATGQAPDPQPVAVNMQLFAPGRVPFDVVSLYLDDDGEWVGHYQVAVDAPEGPWDHRCELTLPDASIDRGFIEQSFLASLTN